MSALRHCGINQDKGKGSQVMRLSLQPRDRPANETELDTPVPQNQSMHDQQSRAMRIECDNAQAYCEHVHTVQHALTSRRNLEPVEVQVQCCKYGTRSIET